MNTNTRLLAFARRVFPAAFLPILSLAFAVTAQAQANNTGRITGRVFNDATKEYLDGAAVQVLGTNISGQTHDGGSFDLANVPAGQATVQVSYIGLDEKSVTVTVTAGGEAIQEIALTNQKMYADVVKLNTFVVAGELEGEAKAITEQRNAPNMVDVIDADTFPNIAGGSVGLFLENLPGISIGLSVADPRTIQVRGMDPSMNSVTINGMRASSASSGNANRQFEIDQISMQDIASVEVTRTARADQDADSGGGNINLISRNAFEQKGMRAGYQVALDFNAVGADSFTGGLTNDGPDHASQILPAANVFYSNSFFNNRLGIVFTANDNEFYTLSPATNMNVTNVSTAFGIDPHQPNGVYNSQFQYANGASYTRRHGVSFNVDFRLSDNTVIFANNQVNTSYIRSAGRGISFTATAPTTNTATTTNSVAPGYSDTFEIARGDAVSNATTAATSTSNNYVTSYAGDLLNKSGAGSTFSAGSKTHIDTSNGAWDINLTASSALSTNHYTLGPGNNPVGGVTFYLRGLTYQLSTPYSSHYPTVTQLAGPDYNQLSSYVSNVSTSSTSSIPALPGGTAVTYANPQYGPMAINTTRESAATDRLDEGKIDIKRTFTTTIPFDIQAGIEDRHEYRDIDNNGNERYVYSGPAINFGQFLEPTFERGPIFGYPAPPMPSITAVQQYFLANPGSFTKDNEYEIQRRDTGLRHLFETVNAAYIESDIHVTNKINLLLGVRTEQTIDKGTGPVTNSLAGEGMTDPVAYYNAVYGNSIGVRSAYTKFFPNYQARINLTNDLIWRLGYNQQMARQQMGNLIPGISVNTASPVTVTVNNPNLPPILFENFDSSLEYYLTNPAGIGRFSVDAYYKKIRNFTVAVTSPIQPGVNYNVGEDLNAEYPGGNISELVNAGNARQVGSELEANQQLGGLTPLLRGFSVYANYTYTMAESNAAYQGSTVQTNTKLPTVNQYPHQANGGLIFSRDPYYASVKFNWWSQDPTNTSSWTYNESRMTCDTFVSYRFYKQNSFFIDARNVFNTPLIAYVLVPYRTRTYTEFGQQVYMGIKGSF